MLRHGLLDLFLLALHCGQNVRRLPSGGGLTPIQASALMMSSGIASVIVYPCLLSAFLSSTIRQPTEMPPP